MTVRRDKMRYGALLVILIMTAIVAMGIAAGCGDSGDGGGDDGSGASHEELQVAAFGGALGEAEAAAYFDPWEEIEGGMINQLEAEASLAEVKLQVESGKVLWDIVELAGPDMIAGGEQGLLEPLDYTIIDKTVCEESAAEEFGLDSNHYTEGIGYMLSNFDTPPTWTDFFDVERIPGRRAMEKYIQDGTLEYALLGAGVPKDELYPLDIDKAIESLRSLDDNVVFVDSLAQASQLLTSGDVVMTQTAAGRMLALMDAGLEVGYNPVGQNGGSYFCIPKDAPHRDEAMKFLAFMAAHEEGSTTMVEMTGYAGPNKAGNAAATGAGAEMLYSNPEVAALGFPVSLEWWTPENTEEATKAFQEFLVTTE